MKVIIVATFPVRDIHFKQQNVITLFPALTTMSRSKIKKAVLELKNNLDKMDYDALVAVEKSASESLKLIDKPHYYIKWKGKYHARNKKRTNSSV